MDRAKTLFIQTCGFLFTLLLFTGCDTEDAPGCFKVAGEIVQQEVELDAFNEIIVYDRINLFIEQGHEQKVMVETGQNLMDGISADVENGRLSLKNKNQCNLFRDYNITNVYVTIPDLTWLQNAGNTVIESVGELHFENIWLRSLNQEEVKGVYTNGDFRLHLISKSVRVTGDDFSNFFLSGTTDHLNLYIAAGDGRVEAHDLVAGTVEIQHRGTNKLFVNPLQVLKGEIRSTGDVISVNRPPVVKIETFYTGRLIFE
ncbi:head GIN domain-containing protein [Salinimicrobium flavum]|uniref:Head GIN domain-containing protein n=1 Tax=Salinimicrobium flavum TaxID=1737065 RepID=A0ABW5IST0_9FLAO